MVDDVARALCKAAGSFPNGEGPVCTICEVKPDGTRVCWCWETFREEARVAIQAAYDWNKRERRWPSFVNTK